MVTKTLSGDKSDTEIHSGESSAQPIDRIGGTNTSGVAHDMCARCRDALGIPPHSEKHLARVLTGKGMV